MRKDDQMLNEAYSKVLEQQLDEGLWNVAKARGSQALGAVKSLGQRAAGGYQQAVGGAKQAIAKGAAGVIGADATQSNLYKAGEQQQREGQANIKTAGETSKIAKYESYMNNAINDLVTDLKRLNIPVQSEDVLKKQLFDVIKNQMSELLNQNKALGTKQAKFSVSGAGIQKKF